MEVAWTKAILVFVLTLASATYDFVVKPEFGERPQDLNITSYVGQTSRLPCTVKHLSGKRVSWIRQRDLQVLSTGRVTFSTDLRISVLPGTRFKLRKPRDLEVLRDQFILLPPPLVSNGTNVSFGGNPANDGRMSRPPSSPNETNNRYTEEGEEGSLTAIHSPYKRKTSSSTPSSRRSSGDHGNPVAAKPSFRLPQDRRRSFYRRQPRSLGHKHHKRQKDYWYRGDHHHRLGYLNFQPGYYYYTDTGIQGRSKKSLVPPKNEGLSEEVKSLSPSPANGQQGREKIQAYAKQKTPIAIYPQGPINIGSDSKSLKLTPNYIDGVWEPEDYTLQIKFTKPQDAGTYICQINTEPRITQAVVLRVVKMRAEILGRRELFVKAGNPVKLSCTVNHGALSPDFILWYKGERLVEYEKSGGRIQIQTEAGGVSHLLLKNAKPEDSSNYTCSPAGGAPASLILNVIVDERQAAMQQGNHCPPTASPSSAVLWPTLILPQLILIYLSSEHLYRRSLLLTRIFLRSIISFLTFQPFKDGIVSVLPLLSSSSTEVILRGCRCWRARAKAALLALGSRARTWSINVAYPLLFLHPFLLLLLLPSRVGILGFLSSLLFLLLLLLRLLGKPQQQQKQRTTHPPATVVVVVVVVIGVIVSGVCVSVFFGCHNNSFISDVF